VDPTGFDDFSARANEMHIVAQITEQLTRAHHRDAAMGGTPCTVEDIRIMGIAHPQPHDEIAKTEFKEACHFFMIRNRQWRTKFVEALEKKRKNLKNLFPLIPRVCMGDAGYVRYGWTKGVICMSLQGDEFPDAQMLYADYGEIKFPASVYAAITRFQNKIDVDPDNKSFLIERREREPKNKAVLSTAHLQPNADDITFAHPGALKYFHSEHVLRRQQFTDKIYTVDSWDSLTALTNKLQAHDHEFGTLALAMHVQKIMTQIFYRSDAVEGSLPVLFYMQDDFMTETNVNKGCNFHYWLKNAQDIYESKYKNNNDPERVRNGLLYWKDVQTFYLQNMNNVSMMRPLNLTCFWELLTSASGCFFGHSATFTAFGMFILVCDGGGLVEFNLTNDKMRRTFALYNKKSTSSGLDTVTKTSTLQLQVDCK
jgi:hypothetical protein